VSRYPGVIFQDKERDNSKNSSSQFSTHLLFSVLSQLTAAERLYMSLAYLAPKRFLMKDVSTFFSTFMGLHRS
jgi:hypothetical protein